METGQELALDAMQKEHRRLTQKAERAQREVDECLDIASEMIAIHKEFTEILKAGEYGPAAMTKLDALKKRRVRADRIMKKDLSALTDKQFRAEIERDNLGDEIRSLEFRLSIRGAT